MRIFVFIACVLTHISNCYGQLDNSSLFFNTKTDTSHENLLFVKIQNLNFLKNNEYSNAMFDGYTLFGYQFNPQLGYQISKNISIEGGIFLIKDFGTKDFTEVSPTFSFRYCKKDFKMVFGNIDGSLNHQLIEPIYNFERVIGKRLENGLQFVVTKKFYDFDLWADWLNVAKKNTAEKEKFLVGLNVNLLKLQNEHWEFRLPFQNILVHQGGQLDTTRSGSSTDFNYAAGITLNYKTKSQYFKNLYLDARYVLRSNNYYEDDLVIQTWGDGFLGNVGIKGAYQTDLLFSYWYGENYYNEFGGDLYSSKSRAIAYSSYYSERIRELIIVRMTKKTELLPGINLTLRAEPYYDFRTFQLEYSYGFYISVDEKIWLKKKVKTQTD